MIRPIVARAIEAMPLEQSLKYTRIYNDATAEACAAGLPLEVDARLRELDFGEGEGLTSAEMTERFPDARAAFLADPVAHHLPGGEDPVAAAQRFTECLHEIADRRPDARVLVVAHSSAIRLALCHLIGVPLTEYRRLFPSVRNCALTELRLRAGRVALLQFNTPTPSLRREEKPS